MAQVSVDQIYIGKRRRKNYGMEELEDLGKDFLENGQIQAITVRHPYDDIEKELVAAELKHPDPLILVAGGRRLVTALRLGWDFIEAYTREDPIDELKHRVLELHENLKRLDMSWDEIDQAKLEMLAVRQEMAAKEGKTITQGEVAHELGESQATFSRSIKAAEAFQHNPKLKQASSRKAALRAADMEAHEERVQSKITRNTTEDAAFNDIRRRIVTADARDFCRTIAPRSVDLVLTDPPYGIDYWKSGHKMRAGGRNSNLGLSEYNDKGGQDNTDLITDLVPLWVKVTRETGWLCIFAGEELSEMLHELLEGCCSEHADYCRMYTKHGVEMYDKCAIALDENSPSPCVFLKPEPKDWIWNRPNSRNRSRYPEIHAQNQYERIVIVNMGHAKLTRPCSNLLTFDAEYGDERIHAMQKPMPLIEELLGRLSYYGDTVLDTFFGSGVVPATAGKIGRFALACDSNVDMLGQAIGFVSKYFTPVATEGKKQSEARYLDNRSKPLYPAPVFTDSPIELEAIDA